MAKDSYEAILKRAKQLNKEIAELNKRVKEYYKTILKTDDDVKADIIRKKIGLK